MFSRRHPYLFFILVNTSIMCGTLIILSLALTVSVSAPEYGEKVGIIEIEGMIVDALPVIEDLKYFRENEQVKAILVRINSPGGGVAPSQEIFREILKTKKKKDHCFHGHCGCFGWLLYCISSRWDYCQYRYYHRQYWCDHGLYEF
ncbi:MAG: hypothetical protein OMM_07520 [Candidatus Magnetoglobus multicellularis str. Araruama]|uniref:Peptidase S49 domain-containing protein n=1 Tax=Candidatus Magnetoglobus multicellularis str. Araruama TaxID=890399 RepID=A0A1V1PC45_9BACT|nr:MAG: hypothetical protein OMM_07520 [Candidatus Magnetoglobus multicellularis str. Araruama]